MKAKKFLFLDYDGVLHPSEVYRDPETGVVYLEKPFVDDGHFLFEHATCLVKIIEEVEIQRPVEIILSTSWVEVLGGLEPAKAWLPSEMQRRVVGCTWTPDIVPYPTNRMKQIKRHAQRLGIERDAWVAIDDNLDGWAANVGYKENLVLTDQYIGLGSRRSQLELIRKLKA